MRNENYCCLCRFIVWIFVSSILMLPLVFPRCSSAQDVSPEALLRGAEAVRSEIQSMRMDFIFESHTKNHELSYVAVWDSSRRRFERSESGAIPSSIIVINPLEDKVFHFIDQAYNDLCVYSMEYSSRMALFAFDFRLLGVCELLPMDTEFQDYIRFPIENPELLNIEDHEDNIWHIVYDDSKGLCIEYWVEEPGFRIHKVKSSQSDQVVTIDSTFSLDNISPIPDHINMIRMNGEELTLHREITVTEMQVDAEIDDSRFTMESINPPIGTPVTDYDARRGLGYWNGESLSKSPTEARNKEVIEEQEEQSEQDDSSSGVIRHVMIGAGLLLLLFVAVAAVRRRSLSS